MRKVNGYNHVIIMRKVNGYNHGIIIRKVIIMPQNKPHGSAFF